MRLRLPARWWSYSLLAGTLYTAAHALVDGWREPQDWPFWLVGGVVFGAGVGPVLAHQRRRLELAVGPLPWRELRRVRRAAMWGPPPADPQLRDRALRFAVHRRDELVGRRPSALVVTGCVAVLLVTVAVLVTPWLWLVAAVFAGYVAVLLGVWPRLLRRRIEVLGAAAGP